MGGDGIEPPTSCFGRSGLARMVEPFLDVYGVHIGAGRRLRVALSASRPTSLLLWKPGTISALSRNPQPPEHRHDISRR